MGPAPSARRPAPEWTCTSSAADCRGRRGCRGRPGRPTPHAGPGRSWSAVWAHHPDGARGHQGRAAPPAPAPRVDRRTRQPADAGHPRATAAAQRPRAPAGQQAARLLGQVRGDQLVQLLKVLQGGRVEALRYETAEIDAVISAEPEDRPRSTVIEAYGAIEGRVQTLSRHGGLRFTLYDTLNNRAVSCYLAEDFDQELMRNAWGRRAIVEQRHQRLLAYLAAGSGLDAMDRAVQDDLKRRVGAQLASSRSASWQTRATLPRRAWERVGLSAAIWLDALVDVTGGAMPARVRAGGQCGHKRGCGQLAWPHTARGANGLPERRARSVSSARRAWNDVGCAGRSAGH